MPSSTILRRTFREAAALDPPRLDGPNDEEWDLVLVLVGVLLPAVPGSEHYSER